MLVVCMFLFFPYPNNVMLDARSTFMSFPITDQDGYVLLGIIGSILFLIALILLAIGMQKYRIRTVIIAVIVYALLPNFLIMMYQETLATGISAISYDGNGKCNFDSEGTDLLNGECELVLHNRSNEAVAFELQFVDSYYTDDEVRMESLMNVAGPYHMTVEANSKEYIHVKELLDVSAVPNHIEGGTSFGIHFKLIDEENARIF